MNQAAAALPHSPAGSPNGMGSSPMTAPGAGAGNTAAAIQVIKGAFPLILKVLSAFAPGSDDFNHVQDAIKSLSKVVGKSHDESSVPSAIQQMALANKGGAMKAAPPIAIQSANPEQPQEPEPV